MAQLLATLLLVGMLSAPPAQQQSPENDCEQKESWQAWQELAAKHPDDQSLQILHALRIGICVKVERNELYVAQGTAIFEKARQEVARKQKRSSTPLLP